MIRTGSFKRPRETTIVVALLAQLLGLPGALASDLPDTMKDVLRRHGVPPGDVSIYVQQVSGAPPALAVHENVARNPASVMKLLTTLVALDTLTPGYTWRTEVYLGGTLRDGRLKGDLIIKGYGDPYLTPAAFMSLVRGLRERGLREVTGDLVLDNSLFEVPPQDRGDFDGQPFRVYNAIPAPLSLNFQATRVHLLPDEEAGQVRVFSEPPLANLTIRNRLKLVKAPCRSRYSRPGVTISEDDDGATVRLQGSYSSQCPESSFTRLLMDPSLHVGGAFLSLWQEMGGQVEGSVREGQLPADATLFHMMESRPLGEVIRGMNKYSNNLMSRLLLLTLGAEVYGQPGTVTKGRMVVSAWLRDQGLEFPNLVLDNGAGLSRDVRIAAASMGRMLAAAHRGPYMPEFMASLAVAGVDGTMRQRLDEGPFVGRAHIKTGSLDDVSTMAGYVLDRQGRRWIVVMLINHRGITSWHGKRVQDALLRWVAEGADMPSMPENRMATGLAGQCGPSYAAEGSVGADAESDASL